MDITRIKYGVIGLASVLLLLTLAERAALGLSPPPRLVAAASPG